MCRCGLRCFSWLNHRGGETVEGPLVGSGGEGAKWNRWAEVEYCQKRLIIKISFRFQNKHIAVKSHTAIIAALFSVYSISDNGLD